MAAKNKRKALSNYLETVDSTFLLCRDLGHSWKPLNAARIKDGFTRTLVCSCCGTQRSERLDRYGFVEGKNYTYQDGYRVEGIGRLDAYARGSVRLASITRAIK